MREEEGGRIRRPGLLQQNTKCKYRLTALVDAAAVVATTDASLPLATTFSDVVGCNQVLLHIIITTASRRRPRRYVVLVGCGHVHTTTSKIPKEPGLTTPRTTMNQTVTA
jgi:hypothetical protein